MPAYTQLTHCRCCGSENLTMYLDLGMMPLANNLCDTYEQAVNAERYPLQVLFCGECSLSQLSVVVDPELLFSNYVYRSSINKGYVEHCRQMAKDLQVKHVLTKDSFMIDIAGNDGALLSEFREEINLQVLNIDPAVNLAAINEAKGIRVITGFWGVEMCERLNGFPKADLITATNVFAHVHDVKDFLQAVEMKLSENGVLVLEFPYLIDFIEKKEFDTVYFEHLSYFSITPLMYAVTDAGMKIVSVSKHDIHGGTVRVTIAKQWAYIPVEQSVDDFITNELEYTHIEKYSGYAEAVKYTAESYRNGIVSLFNKSVAAFAASAKGNTLMNYCGNNFPIKYIVDETPEKLSKFTPGVAKPIIGLQDMISIQPDYLIILSWNFAKEIADKCRSAGYVGKFIIPIPEWHEYEP